MEANLDNQLCQPIAANASEGAKPVYTVYAIERISDGKTYVGLTARSLAVRIKAHIADAMRRPCTPGSLLSTIRHAIFTGNTFETVFRTRILRTGLTASAACEAEILWIEQLRAHAPEGFNIMPGGGMGGPGNAKPVTFHHPIQGTITFSSIYQAVEHRNREIAADHGEALESSTVYARLLCQWPVEEALGYQAHVDGRSVREPFFSNGVVHRRLREVSEMFEIPISTLRSRLYRAAQAGLSTADITLDRRKVADRPVRRTAINIKVFARENGLPSATVSYRYRQLEQRGLDPATMGDEELRRHLVTSQDRRKIITLTVPDGRVFEGGVREVIRAVLGDWQLNWGRPEHLGESAIRRRIRHLISNDAPSMRWAFGFHPDLTTAGDANE